MAEKRFRVGEIKSIEHVQAALRDLEGVLGQLEDLGVILSADAPANPRVLMQLADGTFEVWDIVSAGGCTVTKNAGTKQIQISVP
jgi:hypothetical protein